MAYALFLGCTVPARGRNYELSTRRVAQALEIELVDIGDFLCCGFPLKSLDQETVLLLAARNLALAEEYNLNICTLCNACTSVLTEVSKGLAENGALRTSVNDKLRTLGREYRGNVKVKHFARILRDDVGIEKIKGAVRRDLSGLRCAVHYGCHYLKPSEIYDGFDNPEDPKSLDALVSAIGTQVVEYDTKTQCCGGALLAIDESVGLAMANEKLEELKGLDVDAMILVCPFCSVAYDDNQRKIESNFDASYDLPVLYYSQLLGLALGLGEEDLGLRMNRVKVSALIDKL